MRVLAVWIAAVALAASAAAGTAGLHFPRDHYGHGAGIEWWYFTADVRGTDGNRYSVFYTLFARGGFLLPVSQVVDLDSGRIVRHTENLVPASIGSTGVRFSSRVAGLRYDPARDSWAGAIEAPGYALHFSARPRKPYVLHGGGSGVIRQGAATSRYYSATRMAIDGGIRVGKRAIRFTGTAWFDHQWGDFARDPSALHWDWFSCRFDDRTELMLYRFRDGHGSGTFVDAAGDGHLVSGFDAVPGARVLRAAGRRWPLGWTLRVPAEHLTVGLHAIVADQLVRGLLLPTFWEGAVTAAGTKSGVCFVEETS